MEFGSPVSSEEVTGTNVSRSGRVRKKSSKLLDYESTADETDRRKGTSRTVTYKKDVTFQSKPEFIDNAVEDHSQDENNTASDSDEEFNGYPPENEDEFVPDLSEGESGSGSDVLSDDNEDLDDIVGVKPKPIKIKMDPQDSVYVTENAKKKRQRKPARKTEKKARFSAYMLWAKEVRKQIMKANPNIDFSQLSTRLSVLWASVPYTEKHSWKNKAKRMALMAKNATRIEGNRKKLHSKTTHGTYINKRSPKKSVESVKSPRKPKQKLGGPSTSTPNPARAEAGTSTSSKPTKSTTQSMDVAAHLKLLGESLERIGERLQQHDGGIAVSGSLSVLLDSLLCSAGPLLCLTKYVDQLNGAPPETLDKIIDNVSYIMPGL